MHGVSSARHDSGETGHCLNPTPSPRGGGGGGKGGDRALLSDVWGP